MASGAPSLPAPLVGRVEEMQRLGAALARTAAAQGGAFFLAGEPGVGKTRLAKEAVTVARAQGFVILLGQAHALEGTLAYAPLLEAFGSHLRALDAARRAALVRDLPDLGRLFGDLQVPPPVPLSDPALEKTRLFEAVARLLERLAGAAPVLLFLDDLHWADRTSLELLHYLVRGLATQRVLLLATYREEHGETAAGLRPLLRSLRRMRLLDEVIVPRLAPEAVAVLARALLGGEISSPLLALIQRRSGGTPLFVEMLLGALTEASRLLRSGRGWALAGDAPPDVPPLVRDVIGERLERLDLPERQILDLIAVGGDATPYAILRDAGGRDEEALLAALHTLRGAGLVTEERRGAQVAYGLSHPLIGEVAYAELPEIGRRQAHLAVAAALERHRPDDLERLAHHYRGAGSEADRQRALDLLLAAGERARDIYANEEASRYFASALDLVRDARRTDLLPVVLERLGEAWQRIGENGAAISVWNEALAAHARVGDARAVARLHRLLAFAEWDRGGFVNSQEHVLAGSQALAGQEPSQELADLYLARVVIAQRLGDIDGVTEAAAELVALAQRLPSPQTGIPTRIVIEAQLAQLRMSISHGEFVAARAAGLRALATAEACGELFLAQMVHDQLSVCAWGVGEHRVARTHAESSLDLARRLGAPTLEVMAIARLTLADVMAGTWDVALHRNAEGLATARRVEQHSGIAMALGWRAFLLALRGDLVEADACFEDARNCAAGGALSSYHPYFGDAIAATLALEHGDTARVRAAAAQLAAHRAVRTGFPIGLAILGEAHVSAGQTAQARVVAQELAGLASTGGAYLTALAARVEGLARLALGQHDQALASLARAAELFAVLEIPFDAARARLEWAGLVAPGPDAVAAAAGSLAVFERLGARRYADRARQALRGLGVRPRPVRRPGVGGGPLSRRELEVARLAADGLTTAQIAIRLFISPATAATHLHRIYERLGISSRAALARYLTENGLLSG